MKKVSYIIFLLSYCFLSCRDSSDNQLYPIITFDNLQTELLYSSDIIKNIELIPLENIKKALIGDNPNVKVANNKLYIYESGRGVLNIFSFDGKFIKQFSKKGQGPEEYFRGEDFLIDENDNIEVLSLLNKKIFVYKSNGRLQKTININIPAYSFAKDKEGSYWLSKGAYNFDGSNDVNYKIYNVDTSGKLIKRFLPDSCASKMPITEINFSNYNDKLLYRIYFDNNIYKIENGNLSVLFSFDFGQFTFPKNILQTSKINIYKTLLSGTYMFITKALENDDYVYIALSKEGTDYSQYHLIYSKKNKLFTLLKRDMKNEMDIGIGNADFITSENQLVFIVDPLSVKEFLTNRGEKRMIKKYAPLLNENYNSFILKIQLP